MNRCWRIGKVHLGSTIVYTTDLALVHVYKQLNISNPDGTISLHAIQWIFPFPRDAWDKIRSRNLLHEVMVT